jgi:anti-sigma regulatory factor (Ser/Thr protein kinase)
MTASPPALSPPLQSLVCALAIPGRPEHVHAARAFVSLILGVHQRHDDGIASLLVSELVTNSLLHGGSQAAGATITVTVAVAPGEVRIEVTDSGGGEPVPREAGDDGEDGRGLHLVAELSDAWGYIAGVGRLTTWFELKTKEAPSE